MKKIYITEKKESPPSKIPEIISQMKYFQNLRLANELWDIGKEFLKKERLWPELFIPKYASRLEYYTPEKKYAINYTKESFSYDEMTFFCMDIKNKKEMVSLRRSRWVVDDEEDNNFEFIKGGLQKRIYSVFVTDDERTILKDFYGVLQS